MRVVLYLSPAADADLIAEVQTWPLGTRSQRIKQAWRESTIADTGQAASDRRITGLEERLTALESDMSQKGQGPVAQVSPPQGWGAEAMQGLLSGLTPDDETPEGSA